MRFFAGLVLAGLAVTIVTAWQPHDAAAASSVSGTITGTATFDLAASSVTAQISGQTKEVGGFGYVGWLVNETSGAKLNVGVLSAAGANAFTGINLGAAGYSAYVVTFEPVSNKSNTPAGDAVAKASVVSKGTSPIASVVTGTVDVTDTTLTAQVGGLAKLPANFEYVGWLVNEPSGAKLNVGSLSAGGANSFTGSGLSRGGYTAYVVTYEPSGNRTNNPQGEAVAKASITISSAAAPAPAAAAPAPVAPAPARAVPSTGTGPEDSARIASSLLIALLAAGGLLATGGIALAIRRAR